MMQFILSLQLPYYPYADTLIWIEFEIVLRDSSRTCESYFASKVLSCDLLDRDDDLTEEFVLVL